jgi:ABC-type glycerol-3-phosphate transport system substrate-binding protein
MRRPTSPLHFLILLPALCIAGSACNNSEPAGDEAPPPYRGVHLRFVVPTQLELGRLWAPAVNDWAALNAATVEFVEVESEDWATWQEALANPSPSLALVPLPHLNEVVGEKLAATIPEEFLESDGLQWPAVPAGVRFACGRIGPSPAFLPITSPTPVLGIRVDLLEAAHRNLPETWEQYDRLVAEVEVWAPGLVAVEPRGDADLPTLFLARAVSAATHPEQLSVELDVSSGEPLIATPPYARALEELVAISPHLSADARSLSAADCCDALLDGSAAVGIFWETHVTSRTDPSADRSRSAAADHGQIAFLPLPGRNEVYDRDQREWVVPAGGRLNRPALCGFAGLAVAVTNQGTEQEQKAAWDLWRLLDNYQSEGTIPAIPGRLSVRGFLERPATRLTPAERQSFEQAVYRSLQNPQMACEIPAPGHARLRAELGSALAAALDERSSAQQALETAKAAWSKVIKQKGPLKVLNGYRLRLGLVPLPD